MRREKVPEFDLLKSYIEPEIKEAPDGFTANVMSRIQLETLPVRDKKGYSVPLISATVTGLFILIAFLIPESSIGIALPEVLKNIRITFPDIQWFTGFHFPAILMYVIAAGVLLTVFDAFLKGLFNRQRKNLKHRTV
jgi:hypothetical protein